MTGIGDRNGLEGFIPKSSGVLQAKSHGLSRAEVEHGGVEEAAPTYWR